MAFGIGKAFKKGWKETVGKAFNAIKPVLGTITGAILAPYTGGASLAIGASLDAQRHQQEKQEEMMNAQIASAEKIATMQNQIVRAEEAPVVTNDDAMLSEEAASAAKRRAFGFAKTRRSGSVARRNTLG